MLSPYGVSIVDAVTHWTNARGILPETAMIADAVEHYNSRYACIAEALTVNELVQRYMPVQEKRKRY